MVLDFKLLLFISFVRHTFLFLLQGDNKHRETPLLQNIDIKISKPSSPFLENYHQNLAIEHRTKRKNFIRRLQIWKKNIAKSDKISYFGVELSQWEKRDIPLSPKMKYPPERQRPNRWRGRERGNRWACHYHPHPATPPGSIHGFHFLLHVHSRNCRRCEEIMEKYRIRDRLFGIFHSLVNLRAGWEISVFPWNCVRCVRNCVIDDARQSSEEKASVRLSESVGMSGSRRR